MEHIETIFRIISWIGIRIPKQCFRTNDIIPPPAQASGWAYAHRGTSQCGSPCCTHTPHPAWKWPDMSTASCTPIRWFDYIPILYMIAQLSYTFLLVILSSSNLAKLLAMDNDSIIYTI